MLFGPPSWHSSVSMPCRASMHLRPFVATQAEMLADAARAAWCPCLQLRQQQPDEAPWRSLLQSLSLVLLVVQLEEVARRAQQQMPPLTACGARSCSRSHSGSGSDCDCGVVLVSHVAASLELRQPMLVVAVVWQ